SAGGLGSSRTGSIARNSTADPTRLSGRGPFGYDDEGGPAERTPVVEAGVLRNFLSSRETAAKLELVGGSGGSMRADGWSRMPLVRMTNLHLEAGGGAPRHPPPDVGGRIYFRTNKSLAIHHNPPHFHFPTPAPPAIQNS